MKKKLFLIMAIISVLLITCIALVACGDPNTGNGDNNNTETKSEISAFGDKWNSEKAVYMTTKSGVNGVDVECIQATDGNVFYCANKTNTGSTNMNIGIYIKVVAKNKFIFCSNFLSDEWKIKEIEGLENLWNEALNNGVLISSSMINEVNSVYDYVRPIFMTEIIEPLFVKNGDIYEGNQFMFII